jgi:hypothetical protein
MNMTPWENTTIAFDTSAVLMGVIAGVAGMTIIAAVIVLYFVLAEKEVRKRGEGEEVTKGMIALLFVRVAAIFWVAGGLFGAMLGVLSGAYVAQEKSLESLQQWLDNEYGIEVNERDAHDLKMTIDERKDISVIYQNQRAMVHLEETDGDSYLLATDKAEFVEQK